MKICKNITAFKAYQMTSFAESLKICHAEFFVPFKFLFLLLIFHLVAIPSAFSQSCGQGSFKIQVDGENVTPFQEVCQNTAITFTLSGIPPNEPEWSITPANAGTFANDDHSGLSVTVTWHTNGTLKVDYYNGTADQCEEVTYTITTPNAGTVSGPSSVCSGDSFSLTLINSQNAGTAVWQQCTTGCTDELNWTSLGTVTGSPVQVNNLTVTTQYRTKLEYGLCGGGIDYSEVKIVTVKQFAATTLRINDPGVICSNSASEIVFSVIEETGVAPGATYEWFRNGGNNGEQGGPGDSNLDPKVYDPYDPTYTFQAGETIYVKISATNYCDVSSNPVTITFGTEQFPSLSSITSGVLCEGRQVTFQCGGISGNWHVGTGGFPYNGSSYTLNMDDITGEVIHFSTTLTGSCGTPLPASTQTGELIALPNPQPYASSDEICDGETTSINITSNIAGSTHNWNVTHENVSGPTASGTEPTISHLLSLTTSAQGKATYSITSTSPAGCTSDPISAFVFVYPRPTNPSIQPSQFCDFQVLTLKGSPSNNVVDFRWHDNQSNFLAQGLEHQVGVFPAGNYSYKFAAVSDHGCVSNSLSTINVNVVSQCIDELNWIETINYGPVNSSQSQIVSHSKTYFDFTGKALQSQSKNFTAGEVLSSGSVEDKYGRVVLNSLIAPTGETEFYYKHWFIKDNNNQLYDHTRLGNPLGAYPGTVGWYYSDANNKESHVPITGHPYSRVEYYDDGTGEVKMSAGPGDVHRLGMDHEVLSGTFPVYNELDDYLSKRRNFVGLADNLTDISSLVKRGVQSVVRDQNGNYAVSITDKSGKTVMTARKGTWKDNVLTVPISITSTLNDDENYRPITYFYILDEQNVTISPGTNYVIENIVTGEPFSPLGENSPWEAGFYRIILSSGSVSLSYSNYFLDVSYQFYDDAGRLKSSISPNGFKQLIDGVDYSLIDKTTYSYNHQGWLLSMKEPDAGSTNYKYRADGKIRFSQNAEQADKGRFSYTQYDNLGRPEESGEYTGTQYSFELLNGQSSYSFLRANTKDWVRTNYDESYHSSQGYNIPHLPTENGLVIPEFTQEFLRGAVSWTENANILTWYSYDELGRVVWMAQKPRRFYRTFVTKYTYDFLGNVLTVKNSAYIDGNEDEIFYHHYTYDADQRLQQAFTSTDGTNKKLRATYEYYLHGPLKRIELGDKLQGIDFVYNINGWLTQINHPDTDSDPGKDGSSGAHSNVRKDVFGMVLDYYESSMNNLYTANSGPSINNMHLIHGLHSLQNQQALANHQPLIRFNSLQDPSFVNSNSGLKKFSAENSRYKEMLTPD